MKITNQNILIELIKLNKNIVAPLMFNNNNPNFNMILNRSSNDILPDYNNILHKQTTGCWNVPYINKIVLIKTDILDKIKLKYIFDLNGTIDNNNLVFTYLNNQDKYGEWEKMFAKGADDAQIPPFIKRDQSKRQQTIGRMVAAVCQVIKEKGVENVFPRRDFEEDTCHIICGRKPDPEIPIVLLEPKSSRIQESDFLWTTDLEAMETLGLYKRELLTSIMDRLTRPEKKCTFRV